MPGMDDRFDSNGLSLSCHIARPPAEVRAGVTPKKAFQRVLVLMMRVTSRQRPSQR